jgi:hypothetical protein
MDPPGEPVISTWKRPCQKIQNGSEFTELVAQNFRNPQKDRIAILVVGKAADFDRPLSSVGTVRTLISTAESSKVVHK